ncbi:MAG: hypothetical protein BZ151_00605 [Desulfobacca sp. 4484_104]|nr:MAG: hypothetical protein BZ151_00605 [Desulfobacca sp. 4484_104]
MRLQRLGLIFLLVLWAVSGWHVWQARLARASEAGEILLARGTKLYLDGQYRETREQIRTLGKSKAKLWCQDESVLILGEHTTLEIAQYLIDAAKGRRQSLLRTLTGEMRFVVHKFFQAPEPDYTIETPTTIIGVRATDGVVEIATGDQVYLLEAINPL